MVVGSDFFLQLGQGYRRGIELGHHLGDAILIGLIAHAPIHRHWESPVSGSMRRLRDLTVTVRFGPSLG